MRHRLITRLIIGADDDAIGDGGVGIGHGDHVIAPHVEHVLQVGGIVAFAAG